MSVLYVTEPDEDTGMIAVITDEPCACGWPETILNILPDGVTTRGCASCEVEQPEPAPRVVVIGPAFEGGPSALLEYVPDVGTGQE